MPSTRLDEFPVPDEVVTIICLDLVSPPGDLLGHAPVGIPDLRGRVLHDHTVPELKFTARELWTSFLDLLCVFKPQFHVGRKLNVSEPSIVLFGSWSSCPLASTKHPLCGTQLVTNPRGVPVLQESLS